MLRKFFPRDKNYILEEAQLSLESVLLQYLVDFVKVSYLLRSNPLGIADDTTTKIKEHRATEFGHLREFYLNLAGVFRFKFYGDNQLEFLFDGKDDFNKYREEWNITFKAWTKEFCRHENFTRAILELTVFYPDDYTPQMAGLRLSAFITKFFEVKIDPQKGISKKNVA
ncbi:MAG: hypothetical protein E4H16_01095 [Candidatus Atribacteria bacterium]|nr:MAG: hypothetical protein E4H16_01095 [Candidatus Atribacteria bacterium]